MTQPIPRNDKQFHIVVYVLIPIFLIIIAFANVFSAMGAQKSFTPHYKELTSFKVGQSIPSNMYATGDYYYFVGFSPDNENIAIIQKESLYHGKATTMSLYLNCKPDAIIYIGSSKYTYIDKFYDNNGIIMLYEGNFIFPKEVSTDD
jgi:hypothetical protein